MNLIVPEVTAAVMSHAGSYADIDATYRHVGAWVARNTKSADLPVREIYVVSVDESGALLPDIDLRTTIVWPVLIP